MLSQTYRGIKVIGKGRERRYYFCRHGKVQALRKPRWQYFIRFLTPYGPNGWLVAKSDYERLAVPDISPVEPEWVRPQWILELDTQDREAAGYTY